jgi:hypothetical protein
VQSDSPPDTGTTPDSRSLTDLWRELGSFYEDWSGTVTAPAQFAEFIDTRTEFSDRMTAVADRRNQAAIREHAQIEHPAVAWDAQAAVFTTDRFAEGRTR